MSKIKLAFAVSIMIGMTVFNSCKKKDPIETKGNLSLSILGLKDLGNDYAYEGWLIVDGSAVSAGVFNVDGSGVLSKTSFQMNKKDLDKATAYVLTIEPSPDNDPSASGVHILAGDFSSNSASLSIGHSSALGNDFSSSTGKYILATPTNGMSNDEKSGVWWLDPTSGSAVAGLSLPTLPSSWKYEGWAVINGTPVSTGTFTSVSGSDQSALFSGATAGPGYPGEDFLLNAPSGLTFPTDLDGATIVISVEPVPDNSSAPFLLKPLVGGVPASAMDHTLYNMNNNSSSSNPTGTVSR